MLKRNYRNILNPIEADNNYVVTGYATTFNPYTLMVVDGIEYFEKIESNAFVGADMSDVIMQYDHTGKVFARNSNNTLSLNVDANGLKITADLSKTAPAQELYEDIKEKMITKMSWAFTVEEDFYNQTTRTRHITKIKKIYDVSAVSRPANQDTNITTDISARTYITGVVDKQTRSEQARKRKEKEYLYMIEMETLERGKL